ncbi:MAG: hypothetical protein AB1941_01365 [Gemmatimonadota bacterium]
MKRILLAATAAAVLGCMPTTARAQMSNDSESATLSASLPLSAYIDLDRATVAFPTLTTAQLRAGYSDVTTPLVVTFGGNGALTLSYNWISGISGPSASIPYSSVEVAVDGGAFGAMAVGNNAWITAEPGDHTRSLAFRLKVDMLMKPEAYSGRVGFGVVAR